MVQQIIAAAVVAGAAGLFVAPQAALAQNIANGAPVVAFSGEYDAGTFTVVNVTDGQNATPDNNTGAITEPFQDGSFWLGRNSLTAEFFVIDLGSAQNIGSFQLFNTRNGRFDDRGTGDFEIYGSNNLTDLSGAAPLPAAVLLASGSLTAQTYVGGTPGATPLVPDSFTSSDTASTYQFIRFDALSIGAAADKGFGDAGVGLNEIRVFAVPEPTTMSLLGLGSLALLRRRRTA